MGKTKSRGNGQGTAYKRKNSQYWTAEAVVGWRTPADESKPPIPIKRTKAGFKTKREALEYCPMLHVEEEKKVRLTMGKVYDEWLPFYEPRIVKSTMDCYRAAFKHFAPLHDKFIDSISAGDLQDCMDNCPAGKRTHENMKAFAGLLWQYAYDRDMVAKDVTINLYTGKGETKQRDPITEEELEIIRQAIGKEPFAEYVYAICYLGFRPTEFLNLKKQSLRVEKGLLILTEGIKTEAGKNRDVPVPPVLGMIFAERMATPGTDLLFPQYRYNQKKEFIGYKQMSHEYFNKHIFKPMMKRLGIAEGKTPYCARHTYSDKVKRLDNVDDKTKASVMGHTDYKFTQSHYQSTDINDLKALVSGIE